MDNVQDKKYYKANQNIFLYTYHMTYPETLKIEFTFCPTETVSLFSLVSEMSQTNEEERELGNWKKLAEKTTQIIIS